MMQNDRASSGPARATGGLPASASAALRAPQRANRRPVLLLVGWDGATPELVERFVAVGKLPVVAQLIKGGSLRRLRSTIPPVTACAWSSFLSGKNPGKHGLFDFVTPRRGSYTFDYTNGGYRKGTGSDLLAVLNRAGLRVGCVNVPMTYPPPQVDGFVISGLDAPDEASGIAVPAELFKQVQARVGPYRIDNRHLGSMKTDADRREVLDEFKRIETRRTDVTLAMIESEPVDVVLIVYNATDQVQHHFWHLMDPKHPAYPGADSPEVDAFQDAIQEIYAHCDMELARLRDAFPEANVMLMSDHGAGPTSGPRVRLNNVLANAGLLTWAKAEGGVGSELVSSVDRFLRRTLSAKQKAGLARWMPGGRSKIESMGLPAIDWKKTRAFAYEGFTLSPCIWINREALFPQGTVAAGEEYERACGEVIEKLTALKDSTGRSVIPRVYRAGEIYHGEYVASAPDLILDWWEGRTFTMTRSHPRFAGDEAVFYPPPRAVPGRDITGIHRRDGVLVASGPQLRSGAGIPARTDAVGTRSESRPSGPADVVGTRSESRPSGPADVVGTRWESRPSVSRPSECRPSESRQSGEGSVPAADLVDIAPTVLAMMGLPVPPDMDGQALELGSIGVDCPRGLTLDAARKGGQPAARVDSDERATGDLDASEASSYSDRKVGSAGRTTPVCRTSKEKADGGSLHNHRVVIIGWDGATFDLIDPWIKQGKLPNLAKFRKGSAHGLLRSTIPPFTYPAWTTFLTGKNPGRHGVFDFTERIPGTHQIRFVNARRVRSKTIWRILSDSGFRVGCMGVPVSYPPEPINGVLICGFDAPGSGSRTDKSSVHPPELLQEIRTNVGPYVTSSNIMPLMSEDRYEEALDLILNTLEMKGKTARYLLQREPWDAFMVLFGESDLVGHHFWRFTDPHSPLYSESRSSRVRDAVYQVYAKLDEMLPMLLEACPPDSVKIILSDHGFGGSGDRVIYMNKWLADEGFLSFKGAWHRSVWHRFSTGEGNGLKTRATPPATPGLGFKAVNLAKNWGLRFLPPAVKTHIFRRRQGLAGRMEAYLRFGGIDWSRTRAFSEELPYLQSIWINVKGREPYGIVEPGREYDEVVNELRERLLGWIDPGTGETVVEEIMRRDEVYNGPYLERSPDLLLRVKTPGGYAYQGKSSRQSAPRSPVGKLDMNAPGAMKFYASKSGSHRDNGIFLAQGPMIVPGKEVHGARLMDMAPTILHLLGEPVPEDMEGVVLTDALDSAFVESKPVASREGDTQAVGSEATTYTAEEEEVISRRLRDLGYLE